MKRFGGRGDWISMYSSRLQNSSRVQYYDTRILQLLPSGSNNATADGIFLRGDDRDDIIY